MKRLSRATVPNLGTHPIRVLQFGSGNFLRGFADYIIDMMNEMGRFKGSVEIVQSVSSSNNSTQSQDGLYHVVIKGVAGNVLHEKIRLVSCVTRTFNANQDPTHFYSAAVNADLRFVISNTTEAGIVFKEEPFISGGIPGTFPGKLTMILLQRFERGLPGLIILPCELIEKNGAVLRTEVLQYIHYWKLPADFENWVIDQCIFCNTLVDRIVPGCTKSLVDEVAEKTGYLDETPVSVEPYYFWAIEAPATVKDEFPADGCGLNVQFVNDLSYFRARKVRILNGGHTAMMPVAYLLGLRTVKECLSNEEVRSFIHSLLFAEIIPTIKGDPAELREFANDVLQRFANPFVEHKLASIALNAISKFKVRLLPTILEYHKTRGSFPPHLIHSLAALILFYRGHWKGETIPLNDDPSIMDFFNEVWNGEQHLVASRVLGNDLLWGRDLTELPGLVEEVSSRFPILLSSE